VKSPNLTLVESVCAAWERGDYGATGWADPDLEFVVADGPAPIRTTGLSGMAGGWRKWLHVWDDFRQEVDELRELDDGRILVLFRVSGRGRTSGLSLAELGGTMAAVFTVRDGKVTSFVGYVDPALALAEARRAASPEADPPTPPAGGAGA